MNGGLIIPDEDTARVLNDLARHTAIVRILSDIRMDMEICEIEGWDNNKHWDFCPNCGADMRGEAE